MTGNKRRVLHYKDGLYLPLTETWIYSQIQALDKYEPIVYCRQTAHLDLYPARFIRSKGMKERGTDLRTLASKLAKKLLGVFPQDLRDLSKDKPSLIHAHYGPAGFTALALKKWARIPMVTTFYGFDVDMLPSGDRRWAKRYRSLFMEGDLFLVEGNQMRNSLIRMGCDEKKVFVHHLGIDVKKIPFAERSASAGECVRILVAGGFREKKGIPDALTAFGKLSRKRPEKKMHLSILGDSSGSDRENAEKKKILSVIEKYNLESRVSLLGFKPHPFFIEQLYRHHLFLSPSVRASDGDSEGGAPVSIIEASASGMPVLSTRHCDIPEVVVEGQSGRLVNEHDVEGLTAELEYLVDHPDLWPSMGRAGRTHVETHYNAHQQGVRLEEWYDRLAGLN